MAAEAERFELFPPTRVCDFLREQVPGISEDVLEKVINHRIDGEVFLELDDAYLKEIAPLLGDRLKIRRALTNVLAGRSTPVSESSSPLSVTMSRDSYTSTPSRIVLKRSKSRKFPESASDVEFMEEDSASVSQSSVLISASESDSDLETKPKISKPKLSSSLHTSVPVSNWAEKLVIPTRFSTDTMTSMKEGVLTSKARDEITTSLSTLIMVHTIRPAPDAYTIVCRRLVEKHPCLKDGSPPHYGSWKRKLRQKFKNLRRPARARKAGITVPPPAKKKKDEGSIEPSGSIGPSLSDLAEYDQHINHIQKCYSSQKWSVASMTQLLQETAVERRRWIREDCPSVKEVLLKFPCLTEPKLIVKEFCSLKGLDEGDITARWLDVEKKVLLYAAREDKKAVKSILARYNAVEQEDADRTTAYVLQLVTAMLQPRGKARTSLFSVFEGESIGIEECLQEVDCHAPFIAAFGVNSDALSDFKLVIERENIISISSLSYALHCCFACYYIYNISFPADSSPIMVFFEKYVYGLKPSKKLSLTASILLDNLETFQLN